MRAVEGVLRLQCLHEVRHELHRVWLIFLSHVGSLILRGKGAQNASLEATIPCELSFIYGPIVGEFIEQPTLGDTVVSLIFLLGVGFERVYEVRPDDVSFYPRRRF